MLKHLADEESRAKAHEAAAKYKQIFADKDWEPTMARIQRVVEEDHMRVASRRRAAPITPAARPLLTTTTSAPPVTLTFGKTPPVRLTRLATSGDLLSISRMRAPSTPRERWDATYRGPATPLSPTPTGNAFASGGFWERLTPKPPLPATPVTAVPRSPFSPVVPRDVEARAAYNHVKAESEAMARTVCASRMSVHSKIDNSDDIPNSLVSLKDTLKGAEITLHCLQAPLQSIIDPNLPEKLKNLADDEARILQQYSIGHILELLDIDLWLQVDERSLAFTNLLDAQRERMLMHRNRRKSTLIKVPDAAIQQAWATRILEDAERAVEADGDASSTSSNEDKGYDYNNFLRSIKHEVSSSSDLASMAGDQLYTDLVSMRSSGTNSDGLVLSREMTVGSQRSSTSPKKSSGMVLRSREPSFSRNPAINKEPPAISQRSIASADKQSGLPLRSREHSSSISSITSRETSAGPQRTSTSPQNPSDLTLWAEESRISHSASPEKRASTVAGTRGLSLLTTNIKEEDESVSTPELSPEDKAVRRQGASHLDLNHWAQQLKEMEVAANKNRGSSGHHRQHPAFRHHSQCSSGCVDTWQYESAISPARDESVQSINTGAFTTNADQDFRVAVHPSSSVSSLSKNTGDVRHDDDVLPGSSPVFASPRTLQSSSRPPSPSRSCVPSKPPAFTLPPPPPGFKYAPTPSNMPLHDTIRRQQHVRSKSSIARAARREQDEEKEWAQELKRMESRELMRQQEDMAKLRSGRVTGGRRARRGPGADGAEG